MKQTARKALLSLLCALTLLVSMVPFGAIMVSAEMGCDFPWTKEQTLLEKILQRDGLLDGVWYPWLNSGGSGNNLAGNDVMAKYYDKNAARVELDYYGADKVYREIYNLKAMGFNMMAWSGSIYGEGVEFDEYGDVIGIKQEYLDNARRLLNMCREIGMPVMWNIYFHSSSMPHYKGMDGWNIVCRMLGDRTVADHYAEKFVKPLCQMLAEYPDVVALVSIADEPENEINDAEIGNHFKDSIRTMYGVNRDDMIYFMKGINDMCKKMLPNVPRTVASNSMVKTSYSGFGLDLMGHNRYDSNANINETEDFFTDADIILTEYNIGGDAVLSDADFAQRLKRFRDNFIKEGYKGGFQWCWIPNATDAAYYMLNKGAKSQTDFKETVALTRYIIDDYRAAYQGKKIAFDVPVLYANDGTGLVEWIPSRNATKVTIERSDDGGKSWKTVLNNADAAPLITKGKGKYLDTDTSKPKSGFCYRVTMTDGKNKATSAPNNKAGADKAYKETYKAPTINYPTGIAKETCVFDKKKEPEKARLINFAVETNRPVSEAANLIKNGSFESTSGAQWNTSDFMKYAKVVSDSTAPEGGKSLYFDTSAQKEGAYYKFKVKVKPNTNYTFSTWVKGDYLGADNEGHASVGVWDPVLNGFMVYLEFYRDTPRGSRLTQQIYPTAWDDEWHLRAVQFNSGDDTEVEIALYGKGSQMWLDGIALYEAGNGVRYRSANYDSFLDYRFSYEHATCEPAKSVTQNVRMDDTKSNFWQSGDGWRNGFLSFADNKNEYGRSLKYTASSGVEGNYYIKWVPVQPDTWYVFSANIKILKSGKGTLALVEDHYDNPKVNLAREFDAEAFGNDWARYVIRFNTMGFTKIGIAVCDNGGEALIDNVRLFKASDGKAVTDPYKDPNGSATAPNNVDKPTGSVTQPTESQPTEGQPTESQPVQGGDEPTPTQPDQGEDLPDTDVDTDAEPKDKGGFPWLIVGIAGGAVLLIGGGVAVFMILRKKKQ